MPSKVFYLIQFVFELSMSELYDLIPALSNACSPFSRARRAGPSVRARDWIQIIACCKRKYPQERRVTRTGRKI